MNSIILLTQVSSVCTDLFQIVMVYILLHVVIGLLMHSLNVLSCALIRVKYGYTILERNHILFYINTIGDMFKSGLTFNKNWNIKFYTSDEIINVFVCSIQGITLSARVFFIHGLYSEIHAILKVLI